MFNFFKKSKNTSNSNNDVVVPLSAIEAKGTGMFNVKLEKCGSFSINNAENETYYTPKLDRGDSYRFACYFCRCIDSLKFSDSIDELFNSITLKVNSIRTIERDNSEYIQLEYSEIPKNLFEEFVELINRNDNYYYRNGQVFRAGTTSKYLPHILKSFVEDSKIRSEVEALINNSNSVEPLCLKFEELIRNYIWDTLDEIEDLDENYNSKIDANALCWFATAFCIAFPVFSNYSKISYYKAC